MLHTLSRQHIIQVHERAQSKTNVTDSKKIVLRPSCIQVCHEWTNKTWTKSCTFVLSSVYGFLDVDFGIFVLLVRDMRYLTPLQIFFRKFKHSSWNSNL